ncbi:MAG: calcium-binding EGF-like domain-containing protein [Myxococcota bacterium]
MTATRLSVFALLLAGLALGACDDGGSSDPCADVTCSGHGVCSDVDGEASCACEAGYDDSGATCVNVDECADGTANCAADATCTDTDGAFTCACPAGYSGDGVTCSDTNECVEGTDNCATTATCTNTEGGFTCACDTGYTGSGETCANVDECTAESDNCSDNADCADSIGSFTCTCKAGFSGDGVTCTDIDECADGTDDCDPNATCTNVDASFTCACDAGFSGDGLTCVSDGEACDFEAETTACADSCVQIGDAGVCSDLCDTDDTCPAGWRCDTEFPDAGMAGMCLPNAECGDLTLYGKCEGTVIKYCAFGGPADFDCATDTDEQGVPLACGLVSDDYGYDCVSATYNGGCGEVSDGGSCDGNTLSYCASQANGDVVTVDCSADGLVCVASGGFADCVTTGATGCGPVSASGTCEGTTATWCLDHAVKTEDCSATGKVCGVDAGNFRCVDAPVLSGTHNVTGTFSFEKKALTEDGLGDISKRPVRGALVTVRKASDNSKVAEAYTGQDGSYALQFEGEGEVYVLVAAQGEPGKHNHIVYDCPLDDCGDGPGNLYGSKTANFTPTAATDLGETVITVASKNAGAFNIFDVFMKGADFAKANMGKYPPAVTVEWRSGQGTAGGTSYFSGYDGKIYILGSDEDTDEYDDPVLLHEYGHYLEFYLSRSDSPGGDHDGSKTDPRLAWGEGYGTYIGCAISDTPLYIDSTAGGSLIRDIRVAGNEYLASLNAPKQMKQLMSEYLIAEILWTIATGPGGTGGKTHAPTLDVLANYFTAFKDPTEGRGVEGVELVDFLDGWFCRQNGDKPYIQSIVNGIAKFPYDYAGPANCK